MLPYVANRLATQLLPVLFLASILVFVSVRLIPGDPAAAAVGETATPEAYFAYREQLGLNDPWYEQYFNWIGGVVVGDFGSSTKGAAASDIIWSAFPATLELTIFSLFIGFGWGTVLGILAAINRGGFLGLLRRPVDGLEHWHPILHRGNLLSPDLCRTARFCYQRQAAWPSLTIPFSR